MQILVTGGCGFIGSHLALTFASVGHRVRVVDNFDTYYSPSLKHKNARLLEKAGILIHRADLAIDPLEPIIEHTDFIIHAAAQPGIDENCPYFNYIKNNIHATVSLVETLRTSFPKTKLVHISTSSVYGINATGDETTLPAPASAYGVTKLAAEQAVMSAVRLNQIEAAVIRPFSIYGERERPDKLFPRLVAALKNDTPLPFFAGSEKHERSFNYVGDLVQAVQLIMNQWDKAKGEIFNIGSNETFTTGYALDLAQEISGKKLKFNHLPARAGDQLATRTTSAKARQLLGYNPQTTLREGLTKMWTWINS